MDTTASPICIIPLCGIIYRNQFYCIFYRFWELLLKPKRWVRFEEQRCGNKKGLYQPDTALNNSIVF